MLYSDKNKITTVPSGERSDNKDGIQPNFLINLLAATIYNV